MKAWMDKIYDGSAFALLWAHEHPRITFFALGFVAGALIL